MYINSPDLCKIEINQIIFSVVRPQIVLLAGAIAQPVLIGDAVGISFRVISSILLHTACLTAKGDSRWIRIAGLEITMNTRRSSFGLGTRA